VATGALLPDLRAAASTAHGGSDGDRSTSTAREASVATSTMAEKATEARMAEEAMAVKAAEEVMAAKMAVVKTAVKTEL
jgi:hypothetical protein